MSSKENDKCKTGRILFTVLW